MSSTPEPTFAWLTSAAPAAIAVVRVAPIPALIDRDFPKLGQARLVRVRDVAGQAVDEAVAIRVAEHAVELMVHGGPGVRAAVSAALVGHGLSDHSNVADANHPRWLALAQAAHPAVVRQCLTGQPWSASVERFARRMPVVLITGAANAGKSTLLNAWCGHRRALVSDLPGTTRDLVAASTVVHGWRLRLIDSAGLRSTTDALEVAGQALVTEARMRADLVVRLVSPDEDPAGDVATELLVQGKADTCAPSSTVMARWSIHGADGVSTDVLLDRLGRLVLDRLGLPY